MQPSVEQVRDKNIGCNIVLMYHWFLKSNLKKKSGDLFLLLLKTKRLKKTFNFDIKCSFETPLYGENVKSHEVVFDYLCATAEDENKGHEKQDLDY